MKKIGKAENSDEYDEQIEYLDSILSTLEDLQILYFKDETFSDDYKDLTNQMTWVEDLKQELQNEQEEIIQKEIKEYDKELLAMNAEFERSRL